ncbi:MAG TPA: hypothetical protein VM095_09005 [Pyrinomonadaceae bacterium]|nr:hypothetical protein [Pyrinomonadaceae bacterium]
MEVFDIRSAAALSPAVETVAPYWIWPLRLPVSARRATYNFAGLAQPFCEGSRWIPAAISAGTLPFLISYATGAPGHQAVSALLLMMLCLPCARADDWVKGVSLIALTYVAHCAVVIAFAYWDPRGAAIVLPGAESYWQKQIHWIQTGADPEYKLSAWVPAHLTLLGAAFIFSYTSLGGILFYEGFFEVDLMNFYNAKLMSESSNHALSLALGWHIWSWLRGLGYLFLAFEIISFSLRRMTGMSQAGRLRLTRLGVGLAFLLADGLVKVILLEPVREQMMFNLK